MSTDPRLGTTLGPYRIESVIGRGGMGVVYLAVQENLERRVALKVLAPELAQEDEFRRRFLRESLTSGNLEHPNVVPVYDVGEIEGLLFIAMRYVRGRDLKALIEQRGTLDPELALKLLSEVAKALSAAHRVGLVHRDVKPANVLLAFEGDDIDAVYLTDFGLTKHSESASRITKTGYFLGTYFYASPEQFKGAGVDHRSDIYSLGCVAFECLTGKVPYERDTDAAMMYAHLMESPPPMTSLNAALPPAAEDVVGRALAKEPGDRYDSCGAFITDLVTALEQVTTGPPPGDPLLGDETVVPAAPFVSDETVVPAKPEPPVETVLPAAPAVPVAPVQEPLAETIPPIELEPAPEGAGSRPAPSPSSSPPERSSARARRSPAPFVAAGVVAALVVAGAFLVTRPDERPETSSSSSGTAAGGAATTDSELIAFTSTQDGNDDIFTMSGSGSDVTQLTDNAAKDGGPSWSPDGTQLLFASTRAGGEFDIFVMNADGTGVINLTNSPVREVQPAWSPDGELIAFASDRAGDMEIFTMRANGSDITQITNNDADDFQPSWSSDSARLSFVSNRAGDFDVFTIPATGGEETLVTDDGPNGPNQEDAEFSPVEPDVIAFASDVSGSYHIVTLDLTSGEPTPVTDDGSDNRDPSWSPDGESLVFSGIEDGASEIFSIAGDGSGLVRLTDNNFEDTRPAVSP